MKKERKEWVGKVFERDRERKRERQRERHTERE